jgi:hypothetical protein
MFEIARRKVLLFKRERFDCKVTAIDIRSNHKQIEVLIFTPFSTDLPHTHEM